jgi:protease I
MSKVLMVIAPTMFRDEEYALPREILIRAGADVVTASTEPGACTGKLGMKAEATLALDKADPDDYDAILFVGGAGASVFFDDPAAHALAKHALEDMRVVGAICVAPSILARAGLLEGKRATAFQSQQRDLVEHGAVWTGDPVTVSGRIVTANGPDAAHDFGEAVARALGMAA